MGCVTRRSAVHAAVVLISLGAILFGFPFGLRAQTHAPQQVPERPSAETQGKETASDEQKYTVDSPLPVRIIETSEDAKQAREREQKFTADSPLPVRVIESSDDAKHSQEREQKSDEHEAADLQAQRDAARAAERAAKAGEGQETAAWWASMIALIGTFALVYSLKLSRDAVKEARAAVEVSRHTAEQELRAYIVVVEGRIAFQSPATGRFRIAVHVLLLNAGQTPGYAFSTWIKCRVLPSTDATPFEEILPVKDRNGSSIIGPNCNANLSAELDLSGAEVLAIQNGTMIIYVWGGATYDTLSLPTRDFKFRCVNGAFGSGHWALQPHVEGYSDS